MEGSKKYNGLNKLFRSINFYHHCRVLQTPVIQISITKIMLSKFLKDFNYWHEAKAAKLKE